MIADELFAGAGGWSVAAHALGIDARGIENMPAARATRDAAGLWKALIDGAIFFRELLEADVPHVAVENPVMNGYAKRIVGEGPTQIVQPWMFGHTESKATGLWLRGLSNLVATDDVYVQTAALPPGERDRVHWAPPGPDRWKLRSVTYRGIAAAMADQWGAHLTTTEAVA